MSNIITSITENTITCFFPVRGYKQFSIGRQDARAKILLDILKDDDEEAAFSFFTSVSNKGYSGQSGFVLCPETNHYHYKGEPVSPGMQRRLSDAYALGMPVEPFVRFMEKVALNPSFNSRKQLFDFLDNNDLPITEEGNFLAYKAVRSDFYDRHSGTVYYGVGEIVTMPREKVDDNPENTCSYGLHVCSKDYGKFAEVLLMVEVHPADVVSVPNEYRNAKMRVCGLKVLSVLEDFKTFPLPLDMENNYYDDQEWDFFD